MLFALFNGATSFDYYVGYSRFDQNGTAPRYPFGYGLSYTTFSYNGLKVPQNAIKAGDPLTVEVTVTNTGRREGDEVVQLYLSFPPIPGAPDRRGASPPAPPGRPGRRPAP